MAYKNAVLEDKALQDALTGLHPKFGDLGTRVGLAISRLLQAALRPELFDGGFRCEGRSPRDVRAQRTGRGDRVSRLRYEHGRGR